MSATDQNLSGNFPEGDELQAFIKRRNRGGVIWITIFQAATLIAILALAALLYNIINGAFGYVAVQNKVDPASLVLTAKQNQMLAAPNTFSSEDDNDLAEGIIGNPNAIGFFGYAYYQENADDLKIIPVNGVQPAAETAESGEYPLARPLFIYSTEEVIQDKPSVATFLDFYLTHVNEEIEEVGYFPATAASLDQARQALSAAGGSAEADPTALSEQDGLSISGSSTVYPLSRQLAIDFRRAGYPGGIEIDSIGTSAGFAAFCKSGGLDIVDASRPINRAELEACQSAGLNPVEIRVGTDALAIVTGQQNDFLENVTTEQLRQIFTTAEKWSEVNPAWPSTNIERFIPGADSGTLDFFGETTFVAELADLPKEDLMAILETNLSAGLIRRFESEQPFAERSQENVLNLVRERVVEQTVVKSWKLSESLFNQAEINATIETIPQAERQFRSWIDMGFLSTPQSSNPDQAGIRTAIFGSLWVIFITIVIALPLGVGAAIYLEEYAAMVGNPTLRRINGIIQTNINNLAGVPSIIYGMLGLAIFVRVLEPITSGTLFGLADPTTANGRTIFSASLTLALLILPLIIINAQEAIRAVPQSLRQAGMGLGATRWQTIWAHVLPNAIPGILTGNILAMSRAIGETAPLVVIGASTFITVDPDGPFAKFTTLPIQIYQWTSRPQDEFRNIAAAAIIVLLVLLLTLNASAVLMRNRFSRRLS
ncbi:MAG: phosphate ABC transporter permease PstA [Anaerolineae bacterium]|nr:phosphate ABC transporter permease PstA [Anaerolineae bacterium]